MNRILFICGMAAVAYFSIQDLNETKQSFLGEDESSVSVTPTQSQQPINPLTPTTTLKSPQS